MTNLLQETIDYMQSGRPYLVSDIVFIGSLDGQYSCTWDEFCKLADVEYDDGYGWQEVASDLIIQFKDGTQMYREEYDGSESWGSNIPFIKAPVPKAIKRLVCRDTGWLSLDAMNREV